MDIYFVKVSKHDAWTMTEQTMGKLDEWIKTNKAFKSHWEWDCAYLIAENITEKQSRKFLGFIKDWEELTQIWTKYYNIFQTEVLRELEQLKYRADNPVGRFVLEESLKEDGIDDIFVDAKPKICIMCNIKEVGWANDKQVGDRCVGCFYSYSN